MSDAQRVIDGALFSAVSSPVQRLATVSGCGSYRYNLTRKWATGPTLGWVMLNPSTADADVDDPTVRRCVSFAKGWGFGSIVVRNLYALRATNPRSLRNHPDPVGPDNDAELIAAAEQSMTVCAWGVHGAERGWTVAQLLSDAGARLVSLGVTKNGLPRHPLYVRGSTEWEEFGPGRTA